MLMLRGKPLRSHRANSFSQSPLTAHLRPASSFLSFIREVITSRAPPPPHRWTAVERRRRGPRWRWRATATLTKTKNLRSQDPPLRYRSSERNSELLSPTSFLPFQRNRVGRCGCRRTLRFVTSCRCLIPALSIACGKNHTVLRPTTAATEQR